MLKIKNLSKHFGGLRAIKSCSFDLQPNSITALIGPNGSGKSTIFNLISGTLQADAGQILLDSQNITRFSPEAISNAGISRLFQESKLFASLTVQENLLLALDNQDTKFWKNLFGKNQVTRDQTNRINHILKLIELPEKAHQKASDLSYGQQRLVAIARAVLNPHQLLMLDEPLSGVNLQLRNQISKLLLKLKKQSATILLIEHDMSFALSLADQVVVLDAGKVIAVGTPKQIQSDPRVIKAYLGNELC